MSVIARSPQAWTPVPADVADEELVRRVRRRDQRAFEAIYARYQEPLYRYCHSIMRHREDAEEAFQATMLSAYQALTTGEEREIALRPWLYRIAHNACISALRKRPRHAAAELSGLEAAPEDVGARTEMAEDLRQLQRDLAELPEAQRSALVMRELGGLSHVEIGRALNEDPAAVKQLIYGARGALYDLAAGRDLACASVRRTLSDGDGRSLRGRGLRAHLRACAGCRSWQAGLHARPAMLSALTPVLSAAAFAQIFEAVTGAAAAAGIGGMVAATAGAGAAGSVAVAGAGGGAIGTGAAIGGGVATGGTAAGAAASGGLAVKLAAIGSATLIGGGTAVVPAIESAHRQPPPPARAHLVQATPSAPASLVLTSAPPAAAAAAGAPGLDRAAAVRREARERMIERMGERAARVREAAVERAAPGQGLASGFRAGEPGARAVRGDAAGRAGRSLVRPEMTLPAAAAAAARAERRGPEGAQIIAPALGSPQAREVVRPDAGALDRRSRQGSTEPPATAAPVVPVVPVIPTVPVVPQDGVVPPIVPDPATSGDAAGQPTADALTESRRNLRRR
jgi:RNA polymerase sigma factor (sigma-70 family)